MKPEVGSGLRSGRPVPERARSSSRLEGQGSRASDLVRSRDGMPLPRARKGGAIPDAPSPEPTAVRERFLLPADAAGGAPALPPRGEQSRAGCGSPGPAPRGWQPSRCGCAAAWTRRAGARTGRPARWELAGLRQPRPPGCTGKGALAAVMFFKNRDSSPPTDCRP